MILFLDIDGVMHPADCIDPADPRMFGQRQFLESVVRSLATPPALVISSAWRLTRPLPVILQFFARDIADLIVGVTPQFKDVWRSVPDHMGSYTREAECWAWRFQHGLLAQPWLAIDDKPGLYRPLNTHLYAVDPRTGLTENDVPRLLEVIHGQR